MPDDGRRFKVIAGRKMRKSGRPLRIIFTDTDFHRLSTEFAAQEQAGCEGYAIARCGIKAARDKALTTYMVRSLHIPEKADFVERSSVRVTPTGDFMEAVLAMAMARHDTILEIHTHPGSKSPSFSAIDVDHGLDNGRFLKSCRTGFGMLVLGSEGYAIMEYNSEEDSLLSPVASTISVMDRSGTSDHLTTVKKAGCDVISPMADRQLHIWGEACQRKIDAVTAGIVGLGGTGSVLLQMLVRMGVRKFVLCDPDVIELSNLSRLPYAFADDVGRKKVRVAAGYIKKVARDADVKISGERVQDAAESFAACDVLFGCPDNDGARLAMNELSLKYFIPYIDTGTEIFVESDKIREMGGQVRVVVPGVTGCLECAGAIDREQATTDMLTDADLLVRGEAGYINGTGLTPAPAVITLNTIIASMAAQEFVDMMACRRKGSAENYLLFDATMPGIQRFAVEPNPGCAMCGPGGICGAGDLPKAARARLKAIAGADKRL